MRIANLDGRLVALTPDGALDLDVVTHGSFGSDLLRVLEQWDSVRDAVATGDGEPEPVDATRLGPPVAAPRQVFAIGMNYRSHAEEVGARELPRSPSVFTKFPTCLTGPNARVVLPSDTVDWEAELVVVIGRRAERVTEDRGWDYVAGLMAGQDLSERTLQLAGNHPQYSLGKSYTGFGPTGPAIVSLDEVADPDALELGCSLDGEVLQQGNTKDMVFPVPELIARLSRVCPLLPGDLIFTGTPGGVGLARRPRRFLRPGSTLTTFAGSLGELRTTFEAE